MNTAINNVIVNTGGTAILKISNNVKLTASNNYINTDVTTCGFVNYNGGDFHLQANSPLIDAGADVSLLGISFDFLSCRAPGRQRFRYWGYRISISFYEVKAPVWQKFWPLKQFLNFEFLLFNLITTFAPLL